MDKMDEREKDERQPLAAQETPYPDDTIGSLMAECEELEQYIASEKDSLERFMLETGGASDASDRIEERIAILQDMLASAEGRLQVLNDAQEREAFAPEKERASVIKDLAERKAAATRKPPEMKKERKAPGMDMER